jgi:hypothetical protein
MPQVHWCGQAELLQLLNERESPNLNCHTGGVVNALM